jgi:hypothetical protein
MISVTVARTSSRLDFLPASHASIPTAFHIVPKASTGKIVKVSLTEITAEQGSADKKCAIKTR